MQERSKVLEKVSGDGVQGLPASGRSRDLFFTEIGVRDPLLAPSRFAVSKPREVVGMVSFSYSTKSKVPTWAKLGVVGD